jgi:hypothetical protein
MTANPTVAVKERAAVGDAEAKLRHVRDRGVEWLLNHIADDGEPACANERNGYYRVPWTLALAGEREYAARVLSWVERNALSPDGDLLPGAAQTPFVTTYAPYPLSILAQGAWHLERYDTALAIMRTLRTYQDPVSGGAYMERPEALTYVQFLFPTAQLGLAGLTTGLVDVADAAFKWIVSLYKAQPELPTRLYTAWSKDGKLLTDVPKLTIPASGPLTPDEFARFMAITDFSQPRQAFYNPGIGSAFLIRYFMRTGNRVALEIALDLLGLHAGGTEEQFNHHESMQVCKFAWGSSLALEVDPDGGHLENVLRMADWYAESQFEDGSWVHSPFLDPRPTDGAAMEKTAEHIMWVVAMLASLAGRKRREVAAR